jgi:hypothetical protein
MLSLSWISAMASSSALKLLKIIISLGRGFITSHIVFISCFPSRGVSDQQSKTQYGPEVFENKK